MAKMWVSVVWIEDGEETEGVIPLCWVDEDKDYIHWTAEMEAIAMRLQTEPKKGSSTLIWLRSKFYQVVDY